MDTGFFYLGTMSLMTATVAEPQEGGAQLSSGAVKLLFLAAGAQFIYSICIARVLA